MKRTAYAMLMVVAALQGPAAEAQRHSRDGGNGRARDNFRGFDRQDRHDDRRNDYRRDRRDDRRDRGYFRDGYRSYYRQPSPNNYGILLQDAYGNTYCDTPRGRFLNYQVTYNGSCLVY